MDGGKTRRVQTIDREKPFHRFKTYPTLIPGSLSAKLGCSVMLYCTVVLTGFKCLSRLRNRVCVFGWVYIHVMASLSRRVRRVRAIIRY